MLEGLLKACISLFVGIDPIGMTAIFVAMSQDVPTDRRQKVARLAVWTGGLVSLLFLFLGASTSSRRSGLR